ncbi:MAG: CbiQ family ECF transporter T component [Gallionellaceae bacterium]|nr:CbiQ family ECF transporter T component [Gallionellaceae bacterium]
MPHPAALIFLWAALVLSMQSLSVTALFFMGVLLLLAAYLWSAARLLILLRRTRWIMFSLLLIYAYATPGNALWPALAQFSPTIEGLTGGIVQAGRLLCVLASLAMLLQALPPGQLINGLYTLSYPLHFIGLPRERIAVRLALTLHYAEMNLLPSVDWHTHIDHMLAPVYQGQAAQHDIEIHHLPYTWLDGLLWVAGTLLLAWVLL